MTSLTTDDGVVVRISTSDSVEEPLEATHEADLTVARVGSTGVLSIEPLVSITRRGRTAFYTQCTPDRCDELVSELPGSFDSVARDADAVVEHESSTTRLPSPDLPGLGTGDREVLGAAGWCRPTSAEDHEAAGGFDDRDASAVLDVGTDLRGRGWGDWCHDEGVGETWRAVRDADEGTAVVVNAHGNPADGLLLSSAPFEVLDGAQALAGAVSADRIVVYASRADERAVETVREAVGNYPDPKVAVEVVTGPPEYRAAEPTMALEAIEGNHRLEARLRPPGPEQSGLYGRPTLVHTPRTVAHLAVALRTGHAPETRLVTVGGDVAAPATVELPESGTLSAAVEAVDVDGEFKAACVGGRFGGVTNDLDTRLDPTTLSDVDLGTEGTVQILSTDRCLVEFVGRRTAFASEENCGRCVPCREGTTQLANLLRDVYDGEYDRDGIEELVRVMTTSSICQFGVDAGRPVRTAIAEFEPEFEAHAAGRCPTGSCAETPKIA